MSPDLNGLRQAVTLADARGRDERQAWAIARQAWDNGVSVYDLARLLGVERSTIRRHARKNGWKKRAPGKRVKMLRPTEWMCPNCGVAGRIARVAWPTN